ncbi:MAG: lysylphosphatidylglycerol synthase transmembrane domain-containing protein [Myxococcota bacterium]|nr:lysylphosphatidylglycerol synthase transmembrane domain-containing protein [Myxococcota bacterium]
MQRNLVDRFLRWVIAAIAAGALLYVGGSMWAGFEQVGDAMRQFDWRYLLPMVALTLTNYALRFAKWHYFLRLLRVDMPVGDDAWNFLAGLGMAISPGKAGELLKPYVVRARTGTAMSTTIPALVSERLTDGVAMLAIAGFSVTTYPADKSHYLTIPAAIIAGGMLIVSSKRLGNHMIAVVSRLPVLGRLAPKLGEMLGAARVCLAPVPFAVSLALSLVAWSAECLAFWLCFEGMSVETNLQLATFIYAFATVAGAAMPGGLGVSDGAMAAGATTLMGVPEGIAVGASILARGVTLWLGVFIGAVCLFKVSSMLGGSIRLDEPPAEPGRSDDPGEVMS